jgi:2-polyprenyl-3-methyl-5-hydroxy-6-metoxy-1,4-benzoquinol methylase
MSINKKQLNEYFANHWVSRNNVHYTSVENILSLIEPKDEVLDIGCGYNPFKEHLGDRLYAFDPALSYGNELTDVENFDSKGKQWDVVLCLGSINFGNISVIRPQVEKVVSLVKSGGKIVWRQNPGRQDHGNKECEEIQFFPWSFELNHQLAGENSCKVTEIKWDNNRRIFSIWVKE